MELDLVQFIQQAPTIAIVLIALYFARQNFNNFKVYVYKAFGDSDKKLHNLELKMTKLQTKYETEQDMLGKIQKVVKGEEK